MEFGKLDNIDHVDFALPTDPLFNQILFEGSEKRTSTSKIYIGATGFSMPEWVGTWYAPRSKPKDFLHQYGKVFQSIEHNTTYYRIPDAVTVQRWYAETPESFKFCPKVPKSVSHDPNFGAPNPEMALFCKHISGLQQKLGLCFLQLPPHFGIAQLPKLEKFLAQWPTDTVPLAVEVRCASFFAHGVDALLECLHTHQTYTVITDVAGRRDACHSGLSGKKVCIRFVGNNLHPTDYQRITFWVKKIKHWINLGVEEVYLFCHQTDNFVAPQFCRLVALAVSELQGIEQIKVPAPIAIDSKQLTLF